MARLSPAGRQKPTPFADELARLDEAPIVFTGSRTRAILLLAACLAFIALGLFALVKGENDLLATAIPTALLFGLGMAIAAAQIARPAVMTIAADGVHVRTIFRTWRVAWDEVGAFFVYRMRAAGPNVAQAPDVAAFAWRDPPQSGWRRIKMLRATGCDGTFGGGWPLPAPALVDLLNAARDRALRNDAAP